MRGRDPTAVQRRERSAAKRSSRRSSSSSSFDRSPRPPFSIGPSIPFVLPPPPPNDVVDDARANTPPFHVGAGEDTAPFALRTSPLREKWQEFSAEKPFSEFEPVTVGRVCFFVPPDDAGATAIEWPDPKAGEKVPFRY